LAFIFFTEEKKFKLAGKTAERFFIQENFEIMDGNVNEGYVVRVVSKRYRFSFALPNPIICNGSMPWIKQRVSKKIKQQERFLVN